MEQKAVYELMGLKQGRDILVREISPCITEQALGGQMGEAALKVVIFGNLHQDRLSGYIGHPEFHFDDNASERGRAYIEANRFQVLPP